MTVAAAIRGGLSWLTNCNRGAAYLAMLWTPLSASSGENRSREMSWSSVYVTPKRPQNQQESPDRPPPAPAWIQQSARHYCEAVTIAAVGHGLVWSLTSPTLLTILGTDWHTLAISRAAICVGALLPPASLLRSLQGYVRAALIVRAVIWALLLPAICAVFGSEVFPTDPFHVDLHGAARKYALCASVAVALLVDAAAGAVGAAVGSGARLEHQLLVEFEMSVPSRLLRRLRCRLLIASEAGAICLAPAVAVAAWGATYACGARCEGWGWPEGLLLAAAFAALTALISLIAACTVRRFEPPAPPNFASAANGSGVPVLSLAAVRRSLRLSDVTERPSGVWSESAEDWLSPPTSCVSLLPTPRERAAASQPPRRCPVPTPYPPTPYAPLTHPLPTHPPRPHRRGPPPLTRLSE